MKSNVSQPAPWVNCLLCGQPMDDEPGTVHESCTAYEEWVASRPIADNLDLFGMPINPADLKYTAAEQAEYEAWVTEQEELCLRQVEEEERIGHNYGG